MKKLLALLLCVLCALQLSACQIMLVAEKQVSDRGSSQKVSNFEEFKDSIDETYRVTEEKGLDGILRAWLPDDGSGEDWMQPTQEVTPETTLAPENTTAPATTHPYKSVFGRYNYTTDQTHTPLPAEQRFLYDILNDQQKQWYEKIDTAVKNLENTVELGGDMSKHRNYYIYYLYMLDNPEQFYLSKSLGMYTDGAGKGGLILGYSDGTNHSGYGIGELTQSLKDSILAKKAKFDAEVDRIVSTIPADAPAVVKQLLIYDRIVMDSYYNASAVWDGYADDNWTAYGVIINKYGVCESYSEAFQLLCLKVGINCAIIVGHAGGRHQWNAVELEGQWYACDITADDPIGARAGKTSHNYFNVTTRDLTDKFYYPDTDKQTAPVCNGTKYSYKKYFGRQ